MVGTVLWERFVVIERSEPTSGNRVSVRPAGAVNLDRQAGRRRFSLRARRGGLTFGEAEDNRGPGGVVVGGGWNCATAVNLALVLRHSNARGRAASVTALRL
jgi:hypothetical protein